MTKREPQRRTNKRFIILAAVLGGVLVMGTVSLVTSSASMVNTIYGGLGSAHEHAAFLVMIDGQSVDFSQTKYQVRSQYIHVEDGVGSILHRHAIQVPVGEFFNSVDMQITDNCLVTDDGKSYCNGDGKSLHLFVNGVEYPPTAMRNYVFLQNDRFLLYYGEDAASSIQKALEILNRITIVQE